MSRRDSPDRSAVRAVVLAGPTAVGKTRLAVELAGEIGGEIVTADSMQVYRGMDIGTDKPDAVARGRVPHHLIDIVDPDQEFSVAEYQNLGRQVVESITRRGRVPVISGGSGLYLRALVDDLEFPGGQLGSDERLRLEELAGKNPNLLWRELEEKDPKAIEMIEPGNTRRLVRALEMMAMTGKRFSDVSSGWSRRQPYYRAEMVCLTLDRSELYSRIEERIDRMIQDGLLGEVGALVEKYGRLSTTASQALGYKELIPVVLEGAGLEEAVETVKGRTRRLAKRQLTWLRADPRFTWVEAEPFETALEAVGEIVRQRLIV